MARRRNFFPGGLGRVSTHYSSSSSSVDSEDDWYDRRGRLRSPRHGELLHHGYRHHHSRSTTPSGGVAIRYVEPHHRSLSRSRSRSRSPSTIVLEAKPRRHETVWTGAPRPHSVDSHSPRGYFFGGRSTAPNLHVDIHNRNSDHDHDHSHSHEHDHEHIHSHDRRPSYDRAPAYGFGPGNVFGWPQPAPVPVLYTPNPGYGSNTYNDPRSDARVGVGVSDRVGINDRVTLDHGEVMNQHVCVHGGQRDWYDGRGRRSYHDEGPLITNHYDVTQLQQTAVDNYVHQQRVAEDAKKVAVDDYVRQQRLADDARKAAIREAKLDMKEQAGEIEAAEEKAVRKYQDIEADKKKAGDEAVFKFKKSEAEKKEELELAKRKWKADREEEEARKRADKIKWETEQEKKREEEKKAKAQWAAEQERKKAEEKDAKAKWVVDEAKKKADEKDAKAKWEAEQEKKKKEDKERDDKIKTEVEKRLLSAGISPKVAECAVDPKRPGCGPFDPGYEDAWYRRYSVFEPWDDGGRRWIRVHRRYVMPDTLRAYQIPWAWDHRDRDYIIIQRDYDNPGIDLRILIEHTKRHWYGRRRDDYEIEVGGWGKRIRRPHRRTWL